MTIGIVRASAKICLALLVAACALPALGMAVDFTTSGVFNCDDAVGCRTSNNGSSVTISNDGNTLKMTAIGFTDVGHSRPATPASMSTVTHSTTSMQFPLTRPPRIMLRPPAA